MTFPLLKQLIPPGPVTGATTNNPTFALDTKNDRCFIASAGTGATNGIAVLQISTGDQINYATAPNIYTPTGFAIGWINPLCVLFGGNLFTVVQEWLNGASGWFKLLDPNTFDTVGEMNSTNPGGSEPSLPLSPCIPTQLVPASVGEWDFVAAPAGFLPTNGVSILQAQTNAVQFAGHNFVPTESNPLCCRTAPGLGIVYTFGFTSGSGGHPLGVYKTVITNTALQYALDLWPTFPNPGITTTKLGTVAPSAVDPTWVQFDYCSTPCYDQTDGNLLVVVGEVAASTHQFYLVKINAVTLSVMWATPVQQPATYQYAGLDGSTVKDGVFGLVTDSYAYLFNTLTGAITSKVTWTSVFSPEFSFWDDVTQACYGSGGFGNIAPPPYLFAGTGTWSGNAWWQMQLAIADYPLPVPGGPGSALSVNKAWTYVQDGHTFYVLDCGTQGTWAFDTVTNQWCELQTNGGNFAMTNGIMWGQRVVGGDPESTDVWELDPAATMDSGGLYDITHVVTGGVSTRSRVQTACDSLRLTASFGQLQATGATINLRFSDDQEQTWSPYMGILIAEGDYDTELAWRSLGSFAAPGRIFEISDSGGLIRIDGADAFLNGFDNDTNAQTQQEAAQ